MTTRKYSSTSQETTLTSALTSGASTMVVASASGLLSSITPASGETFTVVIDPDTALEEIVDVISPSAPGSNTLTITRGTGVDGTTAIAHSAGAKVRHMAIGRDFREANTHINGTLAQHGLTTSAELRGVISDETGTGSLVFGTSPTITSATLVTPALGTPASGTLTNATGLPLTSGVTGTLPVANGGTGVTTSTGSGNNVLSTSPTLVTPVLGTPSSVTLTNATGLPIATGVSGLGTGVATFLATPSSANLIAAVTNETGTGALVFGTSPTIGTPTITSPTVSGLTLSDASIVFEGATADAFETTLTVTDPTADRTITLPNVTGTVVTTGDTGTVTSTMIADGTIANADISTSAQIAYSKLTLTNSIANADISASAGIELSKLVTDPLARANHTGSQAASTISDFDTQVRTSKLNQMAAPAADVSMATYKITNLGTPTSDADASTKAYVDTSISNLIDGAPSTLDTLNEIAAALADTANFSDTVVLKSGSTMSGNLAMGTNKITGVGNPTNAQDVVTKDYLDNVVLAPSNLTGPITSTGSATSVAAQTGTGSTFVMQASPTLTTPVLGVATATSINGTTIPSSKTLVATDSTAYVVPSQSGNNGKYLTTDGTTSSWGTIQAGSQVKIEGGTAVTYDYVDFVGMGTNTGTAGTIKVQPLTPTGASTGKQIFTGTTTPSSPVSGDVWVDATASAGADLTIMSIMGAY